MRGKRVGVTPQSVVEAANDENPAQAELGRDTFVSTRGTRSTLRLRVIGRVLFQKLFLVFGQFLGHEDRIRGAGWDTGAAIDTTLGVDIKLGCRLKLGFVF